jgi:hypothetical protein
MQAFFIFLVTCPTSAEMGQFGTGRYRRYHKAIGNADSGGCVLRTAGRNLVQKGGQKQRIEQRLRYNLARCNLTLKSELESQV